MMPGKNEGKGNDHCVCGVEILYKMCLLVLTLIGIHNFIHRQYTGDENDKNKIFRWSRRY